MKVIVVIDEDFGPHWLPYADGMLDGMIAAGIDAFAVDVATADVLVRATTELYCKNRTCGVLVECAGFYADSGGQCPVCVALYEQHDIRVR